MLVYNPHKRLTVEQALEHPMFVEFKGSEKEDILSEPISIPFNDNKKLKMHDYREALYSGNITKKKEI